MATKAEAEAFVRANYNLDVLDNDFYRLGFTLDNGRTQVILVNFTDYHFQVKSIFAEVGSVSLERALAEASQYNLGMQQIGTAYVVAHMVPLADLDPSEVASAFIVTASIADQLEQTLVGGDKF